MKLLAFIAAVVVLASVVLWQSYNRTLSWQIQSEKESVSPGQQPVFLKSFIFQQGPTDSAHSSSIVSLANNELLAVWYGGTREGASDVAIYSSRKGDTETDWSEPEVLLDHDRVAKDLGRYVRKLGNPVLLSDGTSKVWLFFVSTSIGGWSTSAINMVASHDAGHTWGNIKRLYTSPFLNLSTLVKGRPFFYQDGSIGLPAYHELAGKFAELLRVTPDGEVVNKVRITHGRYTIQPSIATLADNRLLALMRNTDMTRNIVRASAEQGGNKWSDTEFLELDNPDAAISVAGNKNGLVLAYNDAKWDRNHLALSVSADAGVSWEKRLMLESAEPDKFGNKSEFSYPYLIKTADGEYHLVYTWQRKRIAYVHFNQAWLDQQ
jgi:predicted neuraminidase